MNATATANKAVGNQLPLPIAQAEEACVADAEAEAEEEADPVPLSSVALKQGIVVVKEEAFTKLTSAHYV